MATVYTNRGAVSEFVREWRNEPSTGNEGNALCNALPTQGDSNRFPDSVTMRVMVSSHEGNGNFSRVVTMRVSVTSHEWLP